MRRAIFMLTLLVFLAASFPAPLLAEEKNTIRYERIPSHSRPPETVNPPRSPKPDRPHNYGRPPGFDGKPPKPPFNVRPPQPGRPGFKPPYNRPHPPQWSINIHNRPKPVRPWYGTCPPYCVYDIYRDDEREEEEAPEETAYFQSGGTPEIMGEEAPEETTYFQSGGNFERMEEEAAAPPPLQRDGYQADMDTYNLMMKAWQ